MRPSILSFCFAIAIFSAAAIGQEPKTSATPWREGKSMYPGGQQLKEDVAKQQPQSEIQKYAVYNIALFLPNPQGGDVVLPFMSQENKLVFYPLSRALEARDKIGALGRPISYGELISLIGTLQIEVDRLKQENDKLWVVVGKSAAPSTVVVQTPPAQQSPTQQWARQDNDALAKYMLLRQLFPSTPPPQTIRLQVSDCTKYPALCAH